MAEVVWSTEAIDALELIEAYIGIFDPAAGRRMAERLSSAAASLAEFPNRGRPASGQAGELPVVRPYVIRYVVEDSTVIVVGIRHGRQDEPA